MEEGVQYFRFVIVFAWTLLFHDVCQGATVTNVAPHYGSLGGETRLTIFGSGFSADQFSQNDDPNSGNKVYLVGDSGSEFSCTVHKDGSTEVQIMCYTPERMIEEDYYVKVVVDGTVVPDASLCGGDPTSNNCKYKPQADNSPTIATLTPQSGKPGSFVTMTGKLVSDRYGSNMDVARNGKEEKLLRVYVGPQDCGLKDGDNFYTLALDGEESDTGTLKCKSKGKSIGFYNASFIIESPYGRSKPSSDLYRVSYNDQIYMFQAYTDITSVSPSRGSTAGGLKLRINGNFFDNRAPYVAPKAFIGDSECVITSVVLDQYVECTVAADPQYTATKHAGNRGVNFEYWTSTTKANIDDVLTLTSSDAGYVTARLDETFHVDVNDTMDNYVSKATTYFLPPHTGEYQFELKGDDKAKLFVDGVAAVTSTRAWASSSRMTLQGNTRYLLEVVHSETTGESMCQLKAKFFNTMFTSAWTGKAVQEKQTIRLTSTVTYDVQSVTFAGFVNRTHTQEVQTVTVESPGQFRFGIYGVYTTALSTQMDETTISTAVNALPILQSDESIAVIRNPTTPASFTFTFASKRGDFPPIHVVQVVNSSSVTYTVTEDTKGAPDMDTMAVSVEGTVSIPFSVSSLTTNTLSTAINSMFEARCPAVFESPRLSKFYESYESSSDLFSGTRAKDTEPFCEKYSLKNPNRLYRRKSDDLGIMLSSSKILCFAYKGLLQNVIGLKYSHKQSSDGDRVSHWTNFPYTYQRDSDTSSETWYYTCMNIYDLVLARYPSDTEHRVEEVWLTKANSESDIYVDATFIGQDITITDPEINKIRLQAAKPNGALIDEATVASTGTNSYSITIKPFDCGNQLPLIELANGRTTSGATASPSAAATVTLNNEGSGSLSISRSSFASPPVTGFIDVTYNGNTKSNLNVSLEAINFKRELETLGGVGSLLVEKTGNCANFDLDVTFLTLPGDLSEMTVATGNLAGINAGSSILTKVDGGLYYDPLTGDMVSTVHSGVQVKLFINDIPVACDGDCSFNWDATVTPTVTAVSPASGTSALSTSITITGTSFSSSDSDITVTYLCSCTSALSTSITITGTSFSSSASDITVIIGGVACSVTAASATSVTCNVGNGPVGSHKVVVTVTDKGSAAHSGGDVTFEYTASVTGLSPTTGSLGGGIVLNVTGYGFKSGSSVTINSVQCTVRSVRPDLIQCLVPASNSSGAFDVVVQQGAATLSFSSYTYDSGLTATVTSVSPASIGVQGATLTISGSSFGASQGVVFVGSKAVTVTSWSGTTIVVATGAVEPGMKEVKVETNSGFALTGAGELPTVNVDLSVTNVSPLQGSIMGGTKLTVTGSGFGTNGTLVDVTIGGVACEISSITNSQIVCMIANAGKVHQVTNKGTDPMFGVFYAYDKPQLTVRRGDFVQWSWETPTFVKNVAHAIIEVDSPSATAAKAGGFSSGTPSANGQYTYQFLETGTYYVWSGYVDTYGIKNYAGTIEVTNEISSVGMVNVKVSGIAALHNVGDHLEPKAQGGTAGGQTLTLTGTGFTSSATATVCSEPCPLVSTTTTQYTCKSPAVSAQTCDVSITENGLTKMLSSSYTYSAGMTPTLTSVSPSRGGTGGGTTITITGTGFGSTPSAVDVRIAGSQCVVSTATNTEVQCVTGSHMGSVQSKVEVEIGGNGIAQESPSGAADYSYIDVWSSTFTWGGGPVPQSGEFIIIPAGMTLLLDTDTPVLSFLLIQGGKLIFDDSRDVELKSKIIMITDGGMLQVGTEAAPFTHKGIITLFGHSRDKELPIYGTKVLAVRNGTLDLHGIEIPITWTSLASTAAAGSTTITLKDPVEWIVGDEIIIASTGDHHSQSENEKKTITAISADKMTLTLNTALSAEHVGTEETFDGTLVEFRAEVGLLTHNVVVRGNTDAQWEDEIKACEAGFNTGEFATQTCFQGRFGDEIGSSQFGGMILVHSPVKDTHEAQARISYTEVTFAGQAFRLGRYPIHFHLNGDMSTSYVRGCGIHKTFNRAVNIHGTHNTMVEKTVIFDIMGGAFFLEDGIETGNTFQYNLAVFVQESSSLLNDDITPASFWLTNPNNTVQHNAAAGGSHFGYWYRMHDNPEGPSFTADVCCKKQPLGVFSNNSAHSFGWFGLWIFPDYFPVQGGCGGTVPEPAVFQNLFAWNNDKGAETVNSGAIQYDGFVLVQNRLAGYEGKMVINAPLYTADSPMVKNSLIVGKTTVIPDNTQGCTNGGIILPYGAGFSLKNVSFVNFANTGCAALRWTRIDGTCNDYCGGYSYHSEQISYTNAPNKGVYAWEWEGMVKDIDGTLLGKGSGWTLVPTTNSLPTTCEAVADFSIGRPASACPSQYKFHRFSFNKISPASNAGKNVLMTNQYGTSSSPFAEKRISHGNGWAVALIGGETYTLSFENSANIQNISFEGQFEHFDASDFILLKLAVVSLPDKFSIDGGVNFINATTTGLDSSTAKNGDWEWDNANSEITFLVGGRQRSRRSSPGMGTHSVDRPWSFSAYKCFYADCIPPPDPETIPPADARPLSYQNWEDTTLWNMTEDGYVTNTGGSYGVPQDYDNVKIVFGEWVVVNEPIAKLGILLLEGVLEFDDAPGANYEINADNIIIRGGRLIIGWPNNPFDGLASITLRGNHSTPYIDAGDGPMIGSKAIGVFGGLDLFGKDVGVAWTQLASTVMPGSNQIVLKDPVTWSVGDDIVIGPTSYNAWETESFKISAIAADNVTLTLNDTLRYRHIAHTETLTNGFVVDLAAAVGLLTRNIKVIGEDYSGLYTESFGARIVVGIITYKGSSFAGYARLSNVEFYHTGQEGWTEEYDPRFSVVYIAVGTVNHIKPSFVSKCAFHNGFNTAVGAFGIGSLNITDNVVFGAVGHALRTSSDDTRLRNNLVALVIATNGYQNRFEEYAFRYEAGIEALHATQLTMQDNLVTGSERIAYHVAPQDCTDMSDSYTNNRAFANLIGYLIWPTDSIAQSTCAKISGYIAWKNHDYGLYYENAASVVFENNVLIENADGVIAFILGPSALDHMFVEKTVDVTNNTFVGATSTFDCSDDVLPRDKNALLSDMSRPSKTTSGGMVGVVFPNFNQGDNGAPSHPLRGIMAYNSLAGLMRMSGNVFANYKSTSCRGDFAVATNVGNDDLQHPIFASTTTFSNVDSSNKIFYHRPNVGKINSADCIDMDCDGLKKALFKDTDGSFLGHVGSVIPQSEFEWGGDPRRGLGDDRVPTRMVTDVDGNRIPYSTLMPNKGVIRNSNCSYQSTWQAYECQDDIDYTLLIMESMDADTEVRRLSPVGLLGDGYIDLINGPQDHGWCSGYTCRLRLSTFHALVAKDKEYLMHLTSVTPKHMRYRLLHVGPNDVIKLTVYYDRPNRPDVFVDDQYLISTNGEIDSQGRFKMTMPIGNEFEPQLANATGVNFFDKDNGELTFIIRGGQRIDVITQETIIISFSMPSISVADFFGDSIVENLAGFLNIPLTKVRVVSVVSAASVSGRKKRSVSGVVVEIEIGDEPASNANATVSNSVDYNTLLALAAEIVNECQAGNVSTSFNVSGGCNSVEVPTQGSDSTAITYSTPTPNALVLSQAPVPEYEGVALKTQPKIRVTDLAGVYITALGTAEYPWQLTASIRSSTGNPSASLNGTLCVNASAGWFNFTDLVISHMGTGYILDFNITYPTSAANFSVSSAVFDVAGRPLKVGVPSQTTGSIVRNARFSVTLDLRDSNTNEIITDIAWRGHTWSAEATTLGNPEYGSLSGITTSTFDPSSGQAMFPDLNITGFGMFVVQFRVVSSSADFNLTLNHKLYIANPAHVGMTIEETNQIEVKFDVDFNRVLSTPDYQDEFEQYILSQYANMWPDVQLSLGSLREGSIIVTFTISGSTTNVNSTANSLCESISNGTSYSFNGYTLTLSTYMTINNVTYYGVTCGYTDSDDDKNMKPFIIALIVVLSILILAAVAILLAWKFIYKQKKQTHQIRSMPARTGFASKSANGGFYLGNNGKPMEDVLYSENSFTSMKFRDNSSFTAAPVATGMRGNAPPNYNEYFKQPLTGPVVSARSRTPATQHPTQISVSSLEAELDNSLSTSQARLVLPHQRLSTPPSAGLGTPKLSRPLSPFRESESPMPPVGQGYSNDM